MTKQEIKEALRKGERVRHTSFLPSEWIKQEGSTYITEEGYGVTQDLFWKDRSSDNWNIGWSIVEDLVFGVDHAKKGSSDHTTNLLIEGDKVTKNPFKHVVVGRGSTGIQKSKSKEDTVEIPRWQLKIIQDALRMVCNIHDSNSGETCFDRTVRHANNLAINALDGFPKDKVSYVSSQTPKPTAILVGGNIILPSGKEIYDDLISISKNLDLYSGYDNAGVSLGSNESEDELDETDKYALAELMISFWDRYRTPKPKNNEDRKPIL